MDKIEILNRSISLHLAHEFYSFLSEAIGYIQFYLS